ncbi:MAG: ATP-binding cassette domain-containing protein [Clostridiales bacterium]|nr:ATP-binding cassette domain-containing protein [Bacillota bacterium]NLL54753.1 ATP-binding cassette domain-containing protein [Clostridiales bacterium]
MEYLVQMHNMTMKFAGVVALDKVSFDLRPGEVHVLLGENGAGKSTLVKILSGINHPTEGEMFIGGTHFTHLTPAMSKDNKIAIIYQELSVIDELSIAENLHVGKLPTKRILGIPHVDYAKMNEHAKELMDKVGIRRSPGTLVQELSISEKQMVEIAKALAADARILIMDEPTSSLSVEETDNLFDIIRQLKADGIGIIYISHKLKEIKRIGDRVTVLKDGKYMGTRDVSDIEVEDLVPMMVGRQVQERFLRPTPPEAEPEVLFSVRNLTRRDRKARNISFDVYKGEILGLGGLIGAGRSEAMEGIFGVSPISEGEVYLHGRKLEITNPYSALKQGIAFVTENRRETGFFQNFEIWKNISVTTNLKKSRFGGFTGLTDEKQEREQATHYSEKLRTKCWGIDQMTVNLSGGNQQKVIVGKWLAVNSDVFIFDEPTKGIDVGAKSEIYQIMRDMVDEGKAVVMVSSDMTELLGVCDRIIVFSNGQITKTFMNEEATEEKILYAAVSAY